MSHTSQDKDEMRSESRLIRGPHGQVKWVVDENGEISNYIGYGSNGNRIVTEGDWPPHIEPIFIDNHAQRVAVPGLPADEAGGGHGAGDDAANGAAGHRCSLGNKPPRLESY